MGSGNSAMKFAPLYVLLWAAPNLVAAQSEVICPEGKSKTTKSLGLDEYVDYKTQDGAPGTDYTNGVNCNVLFKRKKGSDCELKFNCTHFDLKSAKPAPKCQDKIIISKKKYCQTTGPDVTVSGSKLKVAFKTNKKGTATGAVCTAYCVPPPPPPGSLMAIGGRQGRVDNPILRSAEVVNTTCDYPLPEARFRHTSVTTRYGKTLVCGGYVTSSGSRSCRQFDYQSKTWEQHSRLRGKYRMWSSMIELKRGVYIVGGYRRDKRSIEFLARGSSVWKKGPQIPGRGAYRSCVAKLSDTEFVILGGYYDGTQALVYNVETGEWREWPRLTESVEGQSCLGLGDIVLMAGGYDSNRTVIFDTKTGSAREVASLNYPRWHAAIVLYEGKAIILGGYDDSVYRSDGEIWNMDTETWEEADIHLNISRYRFSLVATDEKIMCE